MTSRKSRRSERRLDRALQGNSGIPDVLSNTPSRGSSTTLEYRTMCWYQLLALGICSWDCVEMSSVIVVFIKDCRQ